MSDLAIRVRETEAILARIARDFTPAVFASSLAAEDMVLTDLILRAKLPIGIFSLETGRLHKETLAVLDAVKETYGYDITLFRPQTEGVDAYVAQNGLNAFYDSVEMRRECCRIRKVEPLGRALLGNKAWITGQRRAQSATRTSLLVEEDDPAHFMTKFNPLADWSEENVWEYLRANKVPRLPLDRLRTLHPRNPAGRGRARRTLVVGKPGIEGMRPARGRWKTDPH
jgi:phosphoadenosine phosphosulfate reductase